MKPGDRIAYLTAIVLIALCGLLSALESRAIQMRFDARERAAHEEAVTRRITSTAQDEAPVWFDLKTDKLGRLEQEAVDALTNGSAAFIRPIDETFSQGYRLVRDDLNEPILLVRYDLARDIHAKGVKSSRRVIGLILCVTAFSGLVILLGLRGVVISPLRDFSREVADVCAKFAWSPRVRIRSEVLAPWDLATLLIGVVTLLYATALSFCAIAEWPIETGFIVADTYSVMATTWLLTGIGGAVIIRIVNRHVRWQWERLCDEVHGRIASLGAVDFSKIEEPFTLRELSQQINGLLEVIERSPQPAASPPGIRAKPEETVRDADEVTARTEFLAKVTHELRTPLHSILGVLRIIERNDPRPLSLHYVRIVRDSARDLLSTINQVLDFSKADAGMLTVKKSTIEIREVLRESIRTTAPLTLSKDGLELCADVDPNLPDFVTSDGAKLRHILVNLLGNAIKFTSSGYVQLTAVYRDGEENSSPSMILKITDTGMGIPADRVGSIFEPFTQVESTMTRKFQGTGLGLTIVKQIVEALNGEISVESEVGKGTEFTVQIPVVPTQGPSTASFERLGGARCALGIGQSQTRETIRRALESYGCRCTFVTQPADLGEEMPPLLVLGSDAFGTLLSMETLERFILERGPESVVMLVSPDQIGLCDDLIALGITKILPIPALSDDIARCLADEYRESLRDEEDALLVRAKQPLNILIADDMPTNQLILRSLLESAGHHVTVVNNGKEMIDLLDAQIRGDSLERPIDAVFTDIQMPVMDGITATKALRAREREFDAAPLPVLAVTAHTFPEERERILNSGANDILTKPIEPKKLEAFLKGVSPRLPSGSSPLMVHEHEESIEPAEIMTLSEEEPPREKCELVLAIEELIDACRPPIQLDFASVFERSGDSPRRALLMLRAFMTGHEDLVAVLQTQAWESDEEFVRTVHSLKGLLLEAGANAVAGIAQDTESLASKGEIDEAIDRLPVLCKEALRVGAGVSAIIERIETAQSA